jgi:radical SAM protein with 4Fe4S-binding SPASM domain
MYLTSAKVELTYECPQRCGTCYNAERSGIILPYQNPMAKVDGKIFTKVLEHLLDFGIEYFTFTGGEPLLRKDLLYQGLAKVKEEHRVSSINSSLVGLSKDDAKRFRDLDVFAVTTTFHSLDKNIFTQYCGTDSMDIVKRGIEYLMQEEVPVAVNIVARKMNIGTLKATAEYLVKEMGVDAISVTPVCPPTSGHIDEMLSRDDILGALDVMLDLRKEYGVIIKTLRPLPHCFFPDNGRYDEFKKPCSAARIEITVSAGGDFKSCATIHNIEGNIFNQSIESLVDKSLSKELFNKEYYKKVCGDCTQLDLCPGGCPIEFKTLYDAGVIHPYIDTHSTITKQKRQKTADKRKLLEQNIIYDASTIFNKVGDSYTMQAFGHKLPINQSEIDCISELIKGSYDGETPWTISQRLSLNKNMINLFLNHLMTSGVIRSGEVKKCR